MSTQEVERFFFRSEAAAGLDLLGARGASKKEFRPPPVPVERFPFRLDLSMLLPSRSRAIEKARQIVLHMVGDTGYINGTGAYQNIANHMTRQIHETTLPEQPSFFCYLGDIVYYHGDNSDYHDQLYFP
jgi:hypothetical protein